MAVNETDKKKYAILRDNIDHSVLVEVDHKGVKKSAIALVAEEDGEHIVVPVALLVDDETLGDLKPLKDED